MRYRLSTAAVEAVHSSHIPHKQLADLLGMHASDVSHGVGGGAFGGLMASRWRTLPAHVDGVRFPVLPSDHPRELDAISERFADFAVVYDRLFNRALVGDTRTGALATGRRSVCQIPS